jgi:hypothetical protein
MAEQRVDPETRDRERMEELSEAILSHLDELAEVGTRIMRAVGSSREILDKPLMVIDLNDRQIGFQFTAAAGGKPEIVPKLYTMKCYGCGKGMCLVYNISTGVCVVA